MKIIPSKTNGCLLASKVFTVFSVCVFFFLSLFLLLLFLLLGGGGGGLGGGARLGERGGSERLCLCMCVCAGDGMG